MNYTSKNKLAWALLLFVFQTAILHSQSGPAKELGIPSAILKKPVTLRVHLPEGYASSKKKYAVLYVLNESEKALGEMAATTRAMHRESGTPEMIVVGVENDGDAAPFFAAMEKELIPGVAKKYRVNQDRILHGKDYSGSQVLYAFLTRPALFNGYISATRQWFEDGKDIYTDLAEKAFKNPAQYERKKIFFAKMKGAYDNSNPVEVEKQMRDFSAMLQAKSGNRIASQYQAYDDWGEPVHPDFKECLLFVAAPEKQNQPQAAPFEKHQLANGKWVVRDRNKKVLYEIWPYDNGPDYPAEGLFRIVKNGKIGYADEKTCAIVIPPQFDCAYPFENGKAKVSNQCKTVKSGEYKAWESEHWQYVDKTGKLNAQKGLPEALVKNIRARIDYGYSPSIVVGIIDKDGPQYYVFGTKTIGGQPVDEHSIYEIGSISKTFTGILLAQMAIEGQMKTDDPAQKYLPPTATVPTRDGKQITLGNLSDHTSGLPRLPSNMAPKDPANPYADYTVDQMYAFLNGYVLPRDIGAQYEYSNLAQGLLGHILALRAGTSYEALMIARIAGPLAMKETKITLDDQMKQNLAMGYSQGVQVPNWDIPTLAGAGAIRSSLHDMLLYVAANMGLQKSGLYPAMQLSHQVRHDKPGGGTRVGLGWHISKGAEGDVIWHNGGTGGYRTFAGFVEETGKGVVVLTNSDKGADDIGFHLLNPEAKLIEAKKPATAVLKKAVETEGAAAAEKTHETLKKDKDAYEFNEGEINSLGYTYLQAGKIKEAVAVFKINTNAFPGSSNVYDSYGEALMKDGQKEAAIENYKKSLELNPGNTNAVDMLAKLGAAESPKAATPPESVLESYVGVYELAPGFSIAITKEGSQLFGQATGQSRFELFAKSDTEFFLKVVNAQITFSSKDGKVESLTLFQNGQVIPGKRIN